MSVRRRLDEARKEELRGSWLVVSIEGAVEMLEDGGEASEEGGASGESQGAP